jgi:hypothetical protein
MNMTWTERDIILFHTFTMAAASTDDVTTTLLKREIENVEKAIEENTRKQKRWHESENLERSLPDVPPLERLTQLGQSANDLSLAHQVNEWKKSRASPSSLLEELDQCLAFGVLLCNAERDNAPLFSSTIKEFVPFCNYIRQELRSLLRMKLKSAGYPSSEGCQMLLSQARTSTNTDAFHDIVRICKGLYGLRSMLEEVTGSLMLDPNEVLLELLLPTVERVEFHFVQKSNDRPTSHRIDRLPEWLFHYLRENVLQGETREFIFRGLVIAAPDTFGHLPIDFLNEIVRLVQWVLGERNFFRHVKVVGLDSKPGLLMDAIEQLLRFDSFLQSLLSHSSDRLLKLMDIFVAGDEQLMNWWLEREREYCFATLFDDSNATTCLVNRVSSRAELFGSLIRSIQCKAGVFSFSGPYLNCVASPLCMQFLDAVDHTSTDLRSQLRRRKMLSDKELETNITEWIELINGTHLAALILYSDVSEDGPASLGGSEDLARFGRSLQSLEQVLVDEFANAFVDTFLLEQAKLAAYLMRCSDLLASEETDAFGSTVFTPDLRETGRALRTFLLVCGDDSVMDFEEGRGEAIAKETAHYASRLIRDKVFHELAQKLLEVALDYHGTTPDLMLPGSTVFARDVKMLFGISLVPRSVLRLNDVMTLMTMEAHKLAQFGEALSGLASLDAPLHEDMFTADGRLYEEALSMVHAKGLVWIELGDIISVLNRRRDLILPSSN